MLTIPEAFQTALDNESTSLCNCIKLTRIDGQVFAFTDLDRDLVIDGLTYKSKGGFNGTSLESSAGLAVDNMEIEALVEDESITEDDLKRGLFDGAAIEVFLVIHRDLSLGSVTLRTGNLGDIGVTDSGVFTAEIRGLTALLQNRMGSVYQPTCRCRRLGDDRCTKDIAAYTKASAVSAVTSTRQFSHATNVQATGYFDHGILTWGTGAANEHYDAEVKTYTVAGGVGTFVLQLPMPLNIVVGDGFSAVRGCDRTRETCRDTFDNMINFRGEPDLPGLDEMLKTGSSA